MRQKPRHIRQAGEIILPHTNVEYADWQIQVYDDCVYNCRFCWRKVPLWRYRLSLRKASPIEEAEKLLHAKTQRTVVISFNSDPYHPREASQHLTRETLRILSETQHKIMILTKSAIAEIDFPFYEYWHSEGMNLWFGTTLTSVIRIDDEPLASPNPQRMKLLEQAHHLGLNTWVSIEPWIPDVTYPHQIVEATKNFVDFYVLGRLNYAKRFGYTIPKGYYKRELPKAIRLLKQLNKPFLIKKELKKELEQGV